MFSDLLILMASLVLLLASANYLVDSVVVFATRQRVSTMILGLTVVSIGTSLPELMASGAAAIKGYPEIALGNVIGSNICNVGLILGLPALFAPIVCHRIFILREGMIMLALTGTLWAVCFFAGGLPQWGGVLFLLGFFTFIWGLFKRGKRERSDQDTKQNQDGVSIDTEYSPAESSSRVVLIMLTSLGVLLLSSEFLVRSTVSLAAALGVSENVIAISLIAFGTSVPELSVSFAAAKKRQGDILVGNILGSNISNILLVLGFAASITPLPLTATTLVLDFPLMSLFAALMIFYLWQKKGINKSRGVVLLVLYSLVILRCVLIPV